MAFLLSAWIPDDVLEVEFRCVDGYQDVETIFPVKMRTSHAVSRDVTTKRLMNMVVPDIMSDTQLAPYIPSMIVKVFGIDKEVIIDQDKHIVVWGESRKVVMWGVYPTFNADCDILSGTPITGQLFGQKYILSCVTARIVNPQGGYDYAFINPKFGYTTRPVDQKSIFRHCISPKNFEEVAVIGSCMVV
jgi:hypothetical protein